MNKYAKVIVNADDLGISLDVNDAVFELMAQGRVTSATIMANGEAVDDAVRRTRDFPNCSFGIHLNLTKNRPLTRKSELTVLLNPDGSFSEYAVRAAPLTSGLRTAILAEFSTQVQFLISQGISISHFDSHHHIHTIPGLFGVLKTLQVKFKVSKVRLSMNVYSVRQTKSIMFRKALWNLSLRVFRKTVTTQYFTALATFYDRMNTFTRVPKSIELMVHPGSSRFTSETELLRVDLLKTCPFELVPINYNQL